MEEIENIIEELGDIGVDPIVKVGYVPHCSSVRAYLVNNVPDANGEPMKSRGELIFRTDSNPGKDSVKFTVPVGSKEIYLHVQHGNYFSYFEYLDVPDDRNIKINMILKPNML